SNRTAASLSSLWLEAILKELAINIGGSLWYALNIGVHNNQSGWPDRIANCLDQSQAARILLVPLIEHDAVHSPGLDDGLCLRNNMSAKLGVTPIQLIVAAFFPTRDA